MAGTIEGGRKAREKNLANNPNYYKDMGKLGGSKRVPKGFATNPELARAAGKIGGTISRRKPAVTEQPPAAVHPWRKALVKSLRSKHSI